jgi:hypothetical protein
MGWIAIAVSTQFEAASRRRQKASRVSQQSQQVRFIHTVGGHDTSDQRVADHAAKMPFEGGRARAMHTTSRASKRA